MKNIGFGPADILLPKKTDFSKWSVVACDQYTSEPEYWEGTAQIVGDAPSALNLILPEVYLEQDNVSDRIAAIHQTMRQYLEDGILKNIRRHISMWSARLPTALFAKESSVPWI